MKDCIGGRSLGAWLAGLVLVLAAASLRGQTTLIADTHVNAARPAVNSGAISNLNVGGGYTGLLQFDLSLLPPGTTSAQVSRAVLRMYANRVDTAGLVSVQPLTSAWAEYGVTYATLPTMGAAAQVFSVSQAGAFVAIDVTTLVQGWVTAPATNFGVALTAATAVAEFDSKENDLTAHPATLDVTLLSQGPAGPTGPAGSTGASGPAGPQGVAGPAGAPGAAGPAGATGSAGAPGAAGPQGPQGLPGLGFVGTYNSATNYGAGDVVGFQGSSYISLVASNHGNTPGLSPAAWGVLAAAGTAGATGPAGPQGTAGAAGIQGPAGPAGAAGTPGAAGAQGLPGLVYQGAYASRTNYALGDVVLWQGSSYASLLAGNHGNTPSLSPAQWGLLTAQGPAGATGATGATGAAGPAGPLGPTGPAGQKGDQGAQGTPGQAGAQGLTGATGAQGLSGPAGPQGVAGPVGLSFKGAYQSTGNYGLADGVSYDGSGYVSLIAANHGNTPDQSPAAWALFAAAGVPGATGAVGPAGLAGAQGPQGLQGATGATGPQGPQGAQGPAVVNYTGNYASTTNYGVADAVSFGGSTYVSLAAANHGNTPGLSPAYWAVLAAQGATGAAGPQGPAGAPGVAGAAGAPGATGLQGPPVAFAGGWLVGTAYGVGSAVSYGGGSYIATVANIAREPDISPQYWGVLAAAGAAGPAGATGAMGLQGPTGYPGPAGAPGTTGPAGPTGATGSAGPIGPAGPAGVAGPTGASGAQGVAGPAGATGTAGPQGPPVAFAGGWLAGTAYGVGSAVSYGGGSYIATVANIGREPDISPQYWGVLAAAGAAGPAGATGATGLQGPTGYPGPAGSTGATGPAGPTGASGPAGAIGPAGPAGVTGPPGAAGPAGLTYRGSYASTTNYAVGDAVVFQGSSYISTVSPNAGNTPSFSPLAWSLLAAQGATGAAGAAGANGSDGSTGATGPAGAAATVQVGTVTTGSAGTSASVVNSGSASAAVLNFTIPQGAAGTGGGSGTGTSGTSGVPFQTMYHAVSYAANFYSVNNTNQSATESAAVLTYVPAACSATKLVAFSQQAATITVTLRTGTPGAMADSALSCSVSSGSSCTATGNVAIPAGAFLDIGITHPDGNPSGVWTAVSCN